MASTGSLIASSAADSQLSVAQSQSSKLHTAAQQFEALMIGEMLKAAHSDDSDDSLGGGEDSGGDSTMEMAQSQLSSALAAHGGFGLAAMIEKAMSRDSSGNQHATEIFGAAPAPSAK
jgi:Rod binding domain-containing protein